MTFGRNFLLLGLCKPPGRLGSSLPGQGGHNGCPKDTNHALVDIKANSPMAVGHPDPGIQLSPPSQTPVPTHP